MEREGRHETIRMHRAIRSLSYNRELLPHVEKRIAQAEATIRSRLLLEGKPKLRVGSYEVRLDESEAIQIRKLKVDGWRQVPLSIEEHQDEMAVEEAA